jgi:2Fe-2S ferredoxin
MPLSLRAHSRAVFRSLQDAHLLMTKITFIQPEGESQTVEAENGLTVMEAAKLNDIAGIEAECGGACACATCHVYIDEAWREKTGKPSEMEEDMLDFAFDVREESRLSCQIKITDALDGLVVRVPAKQF